METSLTVLLITAASIGFVHTITGPDHYLPFVVLAKSRKWNISKTVTVTAFCGVGHVLSSIILGTIGVAMGIGLNKLEWFEMSRGEIAAWLFFVLGFGYMVYGILKALNGEEHSHKHVDSEGKKITPWALFIIFVLGPCEPLIPILMYPAAKLNYGSVAAVSLVFGVITLLTMISVVLLLSYGLKGVKLHALEKWGHAIAGATIMLCGGAILFLGL